MAKNADTLDALVNDAIADALRRIAPTIQRHIARIAAEQLGTAIDVGAAVRRPARPAAGARARRRRRRQEELTKWVADRNARRVPTFVIEMTGGLETKKKIVAKFGENAAFEKGKPLPPAKKAA